MNCERARDVLLEADRATLEASADDDLAVHLRACSRCARIAATLLDAQLELAVQLERGATNPPDEVVELIVQRAAKEVVDSRSARARVRRHARLWVPALAAAGVAALLLWPDSPRSGAPSATAAPVGPAAPSVAPPAGRSIAVLKTGNPSITVVWLLEGGD